MHARSQPEVLQGDVSTTGRPRRNRSLSHTFACCVGQFPQKGFVGLQRFEVFGVQDPPQHAIGLEGVREGPQPIRAEGCIFRHAVPPAEKNVGFPKVRNAIAHGVVGGGEMGSALDECCSHFFRGGVGVGFPQASRCAAERGGGEARAVAVSDASVVTGIWGGHPQGHQFRFDASVGRRTVSAEPSMGAVGSHGTDAQNAFGIGRKGDLAPGIVARISGRGHHEHSFGPCNGRRHADPRGSSVELRHFVVA